MGIGDKVVIHTQLFVTTQIKIEKNYQIILWILIIMQFTKLQNDNFIAKQKK